MAEDKHIEEKLGKIVYTVGRKVLKYALVLVGTWGIARLAKVGEISTGMLAMEAGALAIIDSAVSLITGAVTNHKNKVNGNKSKLVADLTAEKNKSQSLEVENNRLTTKNTALEAENTKLKDENKELAASAGRNIKRADDLALESEKLHLFAATCATSVKSEVEKHADAIKDISTDMRRERI